MRNRSSLLVLLSLFILFAGMAFAQTTSGDFACIVNDPSGAVIANASIVATNEATGIQYKGVTSGSGEVHLTNLPTGDYDITATAPGFSPFTLKALRIDLNKTSSKTLTLATQGSSTSVEVSADAGVVLDTTSTNLTQNFSPVELANIPTASVGLGVLNVSLLSPGVASTGGIGIGTGPSVGGQRPRNNNFTVEGIDNNDKVVTGPLIYAPNDAVSDFTLITNQFSPEFGHSSGGQFNTNITSGSNKFHGKAYEYFQNRDLNSAFGIAGGKTPIPRYDNNRYGGQVGGPILHDKLFFFANYERQSIGQGLSYYLCTPTAAGLATLNGLTNYGFNANNLTQYTKYTPASNYSGVGVPATQPVDAASDNACFNQTTGPQSLTVYNGTNLNAGTGEYASGASTSIPLGNLLVSPAIFSNFDVLTTSMDYTLSPKDSIRGRYIYNKLGSIDDSANLPIFFQTQPNKYHLVALSEYHTFTPNLTNEFRVGFNRHENTLPSGNFSYPGLDSFPNLTIDDQNLLNIGPDGNAPQFTIQNLYQVVDNVNYVKGKHNIKLGFDGRKYISPQGFTQRARGDYEWDNLTEFLHDLAPTSFGERSTGSLTYYGDQTALYGYVNDTWRATPTLTVNAGLRYEFTSVPTGERAQVLNAAASVPGLINFGVPQPTYTSFAPRFGINWAPDSKTSVRAGFGIAYDVIFDNLGTLSFPPQYSATNDVGNAGGPQPGDPNFLTNGGLPPGKGGLATYCKTDTGPGTNAPCVQDIAAQQAATAAFIPDQITPYAETYTLTIQRTIGSNFTAEIGYEGTRGIHLPTQIQINRQSKVTLANQLFTSTTIQQATDDKGVPLGYQTITTAANANNLAAVNAVSNIVPAFNVPGVSSFTGKVTSYQPYSSSNYNALIANLTRRFQHGLQMNASYTWSKTMDDATAEVFATVLTPRRPQDSQNVNADYSRSALDRTHRISLEALYDLPFYKNKGFLLKNLVGNWQISPIYTYESPEYATALSGINSNLNGDSATYIDRPILNQAGVKGTGSDIFPIYSSTLAGNCATDGPVDPTAQCSANLVGYGAVNPNAQYIAAGKGTLPTTSRNSLPIRPINNVDVSAYKRLTFFDKYNFEFGAQAFNVLNHAQYIPGTIDNVNDTSYTSATNFQTVTSASFNNPGKSFQNNARTMQLSAKIVF
jgi:hypothetical protein